jgi:hypothetical protein
MFSDSFNRTTLGPDWTAIHYDGTGNVTLDGNRVRVDGNGTGNFWNNQDGGSAVYRQISVPPPWRIEVDVYEGAAQFNRFFQARAGTEDDERMFNILFDGGPDGFALVWRSSKGGTADWTGSGVAPYDSGKPLRARIDHDGTNTTGYVSQDGGQTWTKVDETKQVGRLDYALLCVTQNSNGTEFDNYVERQQSVFISLNLNSVSTGHPTINPLYASIRSDLGLNTIAADTPIVGVLNTSIQSDLNPDPITSGTPTIGALDAGIQSDLSFDPITAGTPHMPTLQAAATTLSLRRVSDTGRNTISVTTGGRSVTLTGRTSNRAEITNG